MKIPIKLFQDHPPFLDTLLIIQIFNSWAIKTLSIICFLEYGLTRNYGSSPEPIKTYHIIHRSTRTLSAKTNICNPKIAELTFKSKGNTLLWLSKMLRQISLLFLSFNKIHQHIQIKPHPT